MGHDDPAERASPSGAQIALLGVTKLLQDLLLIANLTLALALAAIHVIYPTKLFFLFTAVYGELGRGYWALMTASEARPDGWVVPPLFAALCGDALWLLAVVLPALLPFLIVRHLVLRQQGLGDLIFDFVVGELGALVKALVLGALFGGLTVAMAMVTLWILGSPIASKPGLIVDPFTSGIVMVDLLLVTFAVWSERKRSTDYNLVGRVVVASVLAVALLIAGSAMTTLEIGFEVAPKPETLTIYGYDTSNENDALSRKSAWDGVAQRYTFRFRGAQHVAAERLTATSKQRRRRFFADQPANPFLASPEPLYSQRPTAATLDGRAVRVRYRLVSWADGAKRVTRDLVFSAAGAASKPELRQLVVGSEPGKVQGRARAVAIAVNASGKSLATGLRWGVSAEFTPRYEKGYRRRVRVMVDQQRVHLETFNAEGKQLDLLSVKLTESVKRLLLKDEGPLNGVSVLADGRPLVHLLARRRGAYSVVLQRPGGMQASDRATLPVELITGISRR